MGTETGGALATGGGGDALGGDGGSTSQAPDTSRWIVPFGPAWHWYYEATVIDPSLESAGCARTESWVDRELTIQPSGNAEPTTAWIFYPTCTDETYVVWESEGTVLASPVEEPIVGLQSSTLYVYFVDPEISTEWSMYEQGPSFVWDRAETTTVPAGTFTDCWRRSMVGFDDFGIYCRGVGMVSWYSPSDNYQIQLSRVSDPRE